MLADNDVVVNDHGKRLGRGDDLLGPLDIRVGRSWIAGRVIVYQHGGRCRQLPNCSQPSCSVSTKGLFEGQYGGAVDGIETKRGEG